MSRIVCTGGVQPLCLGSLVRCCFNRHTSVVQGLDMANRGLGEPTCQTIWRANPQSMLLQARPTAETAFA